MTSDSLVLLAIILDVFAIFCSRFVILSMFCDLLAIFIYLLHFLMISDAFTLTLQPSPSSTLTSATHRPHTPQLHLASCRHCTLLPALILLLYPLDVIAQHHILTPVNLTNFADTSDLTVHFAQSEIDDYQEKKCYACCYVDIDMEELWNHVWSYWIVPSHFQTLYRRYIGYILVRKDSSMVSGRYGEISRGEKSD